MFLPINEGLSRGVYLCRPRSDDSNWHEWKFPPFIQSTRNLLNIFNKLSSGGGASSLFVLNLFILLIGMSKTLGFFFVDRKKSTTNNQEIGRHQHEKIPLVMIRGRAEGQA